MAYIDYDEKLRDIYNKNTVKSFDLLPITEGFLFYDWMLALEKKYRDDKGYDEKKLINTEKLYKFALNLLSYCGCIPDKRCEKHKAYMTNSEIDKLRDKIKFIEETDLIESFMGLNQEQLDKVIRSANVVIDVMKDLES